MDAFLTPEFWLAVGQIIMIDILLGGDNAIVIALACRNLPPELRRKGILEVVFGNAEGKVPHKQFCTHLFSILLS